MASNSRRKLGTSPLDSLPMNCPTPLTRSTWLRLGVYAAVVAVLAGNGQPTWACNVPVFRYALERWRPDPYRLVLFHRGPLPESLQKLADDWEDPIDPLTANARMRTVDLAETPSDGDKKLFEAQKDAELPLLLVQYPQSSAIDVPVWAGPMNQESMDRLVFSPLRSELVRRLAAGQTAVWLLLESGDASKDDATAAKLETEIKLVAEKLKLPELTSSPDDNLLSSTPLKIAFSVLRVPRGVPAEQPLVDMLLHSESDLYEFKEPMVFPVFGRGRALLPLIGAGITPDNLRGSADFLVGECSCEIKELNPGFDLLLSVDWQSLLFNGEAVELPEVPAVASGKVELVAIPTGAPPAEAAAPAAKAEATPAPAAKPETPPGPSVDAETPPVEKFEAHASMTIPEPESANWAFYFVAICGLAVVAVILMLARKA